MTKSEWREYAGGGYVLLDGATGSNLMKKGMPAGVCPEAWILEHPETLLELQESYVRAGTRILYAPTFTANRVKLAQYGLAGRQEELIRELTALSKKAAQAAPQGGKRVLVAGDLTMTGRQLKPVGDMELEELIDVYKEQIRLMEKAGVDLLVVETMMSLAEARAALIAAGEVSDLPILATMTFESGGRTLFGTDAATAALVLEGLGADAVGVNCSTGPAGMKDLLLQMAQVTDLPLIAKPNAGLPALDGEGNTVYDMDPDTFLEEMEDLLETGVSLLGGCCGTSPEYIGRLKALTEGKRPARPERRKGVRYLTGERCTLAFGLEDSFRIVGERINPTGKKKLQEELRQGKMDLVLQFAREQEEGGASVLDVNMGMSGIDEGERMLQAVRELSVATDLPLSLDSSHISVLEKALRHYPGRALVNSVSYEKEKFEKLLPIVKKYGAMFILLPLSDEGLPGSLEEKCRIIDRICQRALELGMKKEDIVVDGLVTTVGANRRAGLETLETIRYCRERGLATVCGLSNISFGMPARVHVNTAFLTLAIQAGLTMAIANPSQELLVCGALAADLLMAKEDADLRYIQYASRLTPQQAQGGIRTGQGTESPSAGGTVRQGTAGASAGETVGQDAAGASAGEAGGQGPEGAPAGRTGAAGTQSPSSGQPQMAENSPLPGTEPEKTAQPSPWKERLREAVVKGNRSGIAGLTAQALEAGEDPKDLLDHALLPAINEVGDLFDRKKYFLPQLIAGAEAMKNAIQVLEPRLTTGSATDRMPVIVIATVEGDIHDIGKNLVALMLKNYGFRVIDLGKDVPARQILQAAKEHHASIIALSALMTTTMQRMREVIDLVKQEKLPVKVMIGGAVITQEYADEIQADGYSRDAAEAVRVAKRLLGLMNQG